MEPPCPASDLFLIKCFLPNTPPAVLVVVLDTPPVAPVGRTPPPVVLVLFDTSHVLFVFLDTPPVVPVVRTPPSVLVLLDTPPVAPVVRTLPPIVLDTPPVAPVVHAPLHFQTVPVGWAYGTTDFNSPSSAMILGSNRFWVSNTSYCPLTSSRSWVFSTIVLGHGASAAKIFFIKKLTQTVENDDTLLLNRTV